MDIIEILKSHFKEHMTDEISESIKTSYDLLVSGKVEEQKVKIVEEYETKLKESTEAGLIELEEKLDTYITKANEELIDENLKNVESTSKVELAEKIINGVLLTIKENNMNIAIEDKDVIKQLEDENTKLETSLNESVDTIAESKKEVFEHEKAIAILNMTKDLADTQSEKVIAMVEHVVVADIEDFKTKIKSAIELVSEKKEEKKEEDLLDENFKKKETEISQFKPKWLE